MINNNKNMNFEKNNKYYLTSYITPKNKKYINIIFNKDIDLSVYNNLTHLTLGHDFNQKIDLSNNNNLICLKINGIYDKNIIIPKSVEN